MKKIWLLYAFVLYFFACKQDTSQNTNEVLSNIPVQLVCEDIGSTDELPKYAVYAVIQERKTKVLEISSACQAIEKDQYSTFQIPMDAHAAVGGWWAGAGDYFYAQSVGDKISIFHGVMDEAQESSNYNYKKIATYENGKFDVQQ